MARRPNRVFFSRLKDLVSKIKKVSAPLKERSKKIYRFVYHHVQTRPLTSFAVLLVLLLFLIATGSFLTKPKTEKIEAENLEKEVQVFNIGKAPTLVMHAQIEKSGVVQIVAQSPGIVARLNVKDGQTVSRGTTLVSLGNNYQGASAASVQRQLAQVQYNNAASTFNLQKEIITKQREVADKTDSSADEIRDITNKSLDETRSLVSLNENILGTIDDNLETLEATNVGGANDSLILQTKQLKSQFLAGTNQARSALRQAELATKGDGAQTQLSNLGREILQKQLDLQEKTLGLQLESARLQLNLAQINESVMFPTSPFAGVVERVHVKVGQTVSPGTTLVTISSTNKSLKAIALASEHIAKNVSRLESSFLIIDSEKIENKPLYISQEATNNQLYSIIFAIPQELSDKLTDLGFIDVEVPIGVSSASSTVYVPVDAVHQTQDSTEVFVIHDKIAESRKVTLGEVQGSFVQITSGLENNDAVILSRNVTSGDRVKEKIS